MVKDLMGFLYEEFKKDWDQKNPVPEDGQEKTPSATELLTFARDYLLEHPPVSFDYISRGLGVTLRNSQYCTFLNLPGTEKAFPVHGGEIAITDQNRDINTTDIMNALGIKI
jgi:hypothetical protein